MKASILQKQKSRSPLEAMKRIQATGAGGREKSLFFSLNLTTLIDAFCILVIFLLSNMNGQIQNLQAGKDLVLPAALKTEALQSGLVIRIEKNEMFLEDKKISKDEIAKVLLAAKTPENSSLIIQADRRSDYENIGMVLRAGGQAGYEKYVFAVLPGT
jgi:biopolymer transport protein ExbD